MLHNVQNKILQIASIFLSDFLGDPLLGDGYNFVNNYLIHERTTLNDS